MSLFRTEDLIKLKGLTPTAQALLMIMTARQNQKTRECSFPERIWAKDIGRTEKTVRVYIAELENSGHIKVTRYPHNSRVHSDYELLFQDWPAEDAEEDEDELELEAEWSMPDDQYEAEIEANRIKVRRSTPTAGQGNIPTAGRRSTSTADQRSTPTVITDKRIKKGKQNKVTVR